MRPARRVRPTRGSRRGSLRGLALSISGALAGTLVVAAVGALAATEARAQYVEFLGGQTGVPLPGRLSTLRLDSMGGIRLVIPDENTEYNLSDFSSNPAGIAADKDRWSVDTWFGRWANAADFNSSFAGSPIRQRASVHQDIGVGEAIYRSGGRFAVGGGFSWLGHRASIRYGDERRARGPLGRALVAYRFSRFDVGLDVTRWVDNEDVVSSDIFNIRHQTSAWLTSLGVGTTLWGLRLGALARLDMVEITGKSRDASGFHQDDFTWHRPTTNFRLTALREARSPGAGLEAGINVDVISRNGTEEALISWSDRFPDNPSRIDYSARVPTFDEEERGLAVSARARYNLSRALRVAASASREAFSSEVVESVNFVGSRRAQDLEQTRTSLRGGVGYLFPDRDLQVGMELGLRTGNDDLELARSGSDVDQRAVDFSAGGEWLVRPDVAVRLGYERAGIDEDIDAPDSYRVANGVTLGVGYLPRGGIFAIDAGMRARRERPEETSGVNRRVDLFDFAVSSRFLF